MSGWIDDGAFCPAPHLLPQCCVPVLPGFPDGAEPPLLHLSLVIRGHQCFGFGIGSCPKLAGGIFCYGCMMNSNKVSFIAQNVSTFIGCYI